MAILKKIHFYFGLIIIAHFIITGVLMRMNYLSLDPEDTLVRMMLRANHIYILFSGLINILISYCLKPEGEVKLYHYVASSILMLATIGISTSFYTDPAIHLGIVPHLIQRKLTAYSVQGSLFGTVIHLLLLQFSHEKSNLQPPPSRSDL